MISFIWFIQGARKARNGTVEIVENGNWVELIGEAHLVHLNLLLQQFEKPFLRETSLINGTLQQTDFQLPLTSGLGDVVD